MGTRSVAVVLISAAAALASLGAHGSLPAARQPQLANQVVQMKSAFLKTLPNDDLRAKTAPGPAAGSQRTARANIELDLKIFCPQKSALKTGHRRPAAGDSQADGSSAELGRAGRRVRRRAPVWKSLSLHPISKRETRRKDDKYNDEPSRKKNHGGKIWHSKTSFLKIGNLNSTNIRYFSDHANHKKRRIEPRMSENFIGKSSQAHKLRAHRKNNRITIAENFQLTPYITEQRSLMKPHLYHSVLRRKLTNASFSNENNVSNTGFENIRQSKSPNSVEFLDFDRAKTPRNNDPQLTNEGVQSSSARSKPGEQSLSKVNFHKERISSPKARETKALTQQGQGVKEWREKIGSSLIRLGRSSAQSLAANASHVPVHKRTSVQYSSLVGPSFLNTTYHERVRALAGQTAVLACVVRNLHNYTVSWVRARDISLLTAGLNAYSSDTRFVSSNPGSGVRWQLKIHHVRLADAGTYLCQVSATPPITTPVHLTVTEANATVEPGHEVFVKVGSPVLLLCTVRGCPAPVRPLWYRGGQLLEGVRVVEEGPPDGNTSTPSPATPEASLELRPEGLQRQGAQGEELRDEECSSRNCWRATTVVFERSKASVQHSGLYICRNTCTPPLNLTLHVLLDEETAAMQHINGAADRRPWSGCLPCLLLLVLLATRFSCGADAYTYIAPQTRKCKMGFKKHKVQ